MADYFREIRILSDTLPGLELASEAIGIPDWAKKEAKEMIRVRKEAIKLLEDQG